MDEGQGPGDIEIRMQGHGQGPGGIAGNGSLPRGAGGAVAVSRHIACQVALFDRQGKLARLLTRTGATGRHQHDLAPPCRERGIGHGPGVVLPPDEKLPQGGPAQIGE